MLTLASDRSAGVLYEAYRDRRGCGRIAVRSGLRRYELSLTVGPGRRWNASAAAALLHSAGAPDVSAERAQQFCDDVLERLPYDGFTLTEDTIRAWLARERVA